MILEIRILGVFLGSLSLVYSSPQSKLLGDAENQDDRIFAHTICRHGDRNIYGELGNDPITMEHNWPEGYMQLTKTGKQQQYKLGQYLRNRYSKLLGDDGYSYKKVNVQSTDTDRTIMSAQSALAGLFPPTPKELWEPTVNWQPIPVHVVPLVEDSILSVERQCDHYAYEVTKHVYNDEFKNGIFDTNKSAIKELERMSGLNLTDFQILCALTDTLFIENLKETELNMKLEPWTKEAFKYLTVLQNIQTSVLHALTETSTMKKLRSGFLLKEILDRFTNKSQSQLNPEQVLWMYFAHDITIIDMLNSLGLITTPHMPPYASCVFFELFRGSASDYVQIFYKKGDEKHAKTTTNTQLRQAMSIAETLPIV